MPSSVHEGFVLAPLTETDAREIAGWQYAGEYAVYNCDPDDGEEAVRSFLNPEYAYHSVRHGDYGLAGFCCFGEDAQVPGGDYAVEAVDIGLGLRPDLVGRGMGQAFLRSVLEFLDRDGNAKPLRATIAAFNGRSRRLFEKAGFTQVQVFRAETAHDTDGLEFVVLVKDADPGI